MLNDLEDLEDILGSLVFEDEPSILTEEYAVDMLETAFHLMDEYMNEHPNAISEPDFHEILLDEIKDLMYVQMEDHMLRSDYVEDDVNDVLEVAFQIYISTFHTERSLYNMNDNDDDDNNDNKDIYISKEIDLENENSDYAIIADKIKALKEIPQPVQRTPEWYKFRWNLITASNAWKAFETQSTINQLIYEKCQPLKDYDNSNSTDDDVVMVNTKSTLHWGQKYEPLSVLMYEHMYNSTVEDFGCIQHPQYKFIGASPDGIITKSSSGRYGRMLEIKNIVNREINGIPKKEYWIQMQLQMEVCDLDECDFLETKFVEYPDYESYKADSTSAFHNGCEFNSLTTTKDGSYKGTIIYFHTKEGKPHYEYMPLHIWQPDEACAWEQDTLSKYEGKDHNYVFIKFIYWKLEKISCVLVKRNRDWFKNNVQQLEKVWKIIEQERVTGYEHRAPIKKQRLVTKPNTNSSTEICLLKVVKLE